MVVNLAIGSPKQGSRGGRGQVCDMTLCTRMWPPHLCFQTDGKGDGSRLIVVKGAVVQVIAVPHHLQRRSRQQLLLQHVRLPRAHERGVHCCAGSHAAPEPRVTMQPPAARWKQILDISNTQCRGYITYIPPAQCLTFVLSTWRQVMGASTVPLACKPICQIL